MRASAPMSAAWRRASPARACSAVTLDRGRNAVELRRGARRPQRPDHEGGAAARHHPDALPPEYAAELHEAAERGAADGLGLRQAPHDGRARRRLAERNSRASSTSRPRPPRSARCIARARTTARELACKLQYPDMQSAVEADLQQLELAVRHPPAHGPGDRHHRDRPRRSARACARSSTTSARPSTSRSTATCWPDDDAIRVPRVVARAVDRPAADARLARGQPAARAQGRRARRPQPPRHGDVHRLVASRSAASA